MQREHLSRLFGTFSYDPAKVLYFPDGLYGYTRYKEFVLKKSKQTGPFVWLLSVEDGGPEIALIDPRIVDPEYGIENVPVDNRILEELEAERKEELRLYAVVSFPQHIALLSMNLKTPILINTARHLGMEYPLPGVDRKPVRRYIYKEITKDPQVANIRTLFVRRRQDQSICIGSDIEVDVVEVTNRGVRVRIRAPQDIAIERSRWMDNPRDETIRANQLTSLAEPLSITRTRDRYSGMEDTAEKPSSAMPVRGTVSPLFPDLGGPSRRDEGADSSKAPEEE